MNSIKHIRTRLGLTQAELASLLGRSQGNISLYEAGQTVPPDVARKLIATAAERGHAITFDDVYANAAQPEPVDRERRRIRRKVSIGELSSKSN